MKKLIIAGLLVSQPLLAATPDYRCLQGTWQVDAIKVVDSPIQAVEVNDPQYMGAEVAFSPQKILWIKGTRQRPVDASIDNCRQKPMLTPAVKNHRAQGEVKEEFNLLCGAEPWGPGAVVTLPQHGRMTLYWYDGAILSLHKVVK